MVIVSHRVSKETDLHSLKISCSSRRAEDQQPYSEDLCEANVGHVLPIRKKMINIE